MLQIYYSAISASLTAKKNQQRLIIILDSLKIEYSLIEISTISDVLLLDDIKSYKKYPILFVNNKYKGCFDDFDDHNENGDLKEWICKGEE